MNIYPETKSISEIFPIEGDIKYNIPSYQRNYSWTNSNIEELYNDVNNEDQGYYIGNFIVTENVNGYLDIVDGQQRLTTIALFLLAVFEEVQSLQSKEPTLKDNDDAMRIKVDIKRKLKTTENKERLKLLKPDAGMFENYLRVFEGREKGKFGNRVFGKRYSFIQGLLKNQDIEDPIERFKILFEFYTKLNSVELLRIKVDNISDAFTVFTSLNAKGLPLTLIDLLKSYYLGQATKDGIEDEEALQDWEELILTFTPDQDEPNSTAISQFLQNNYDAFEGKGNSSITKKGSLHAYQRLFQEVGYKYIDTLLENATLFSLMVPNIEAKRPTEDYSQDILELLNKISRLEASPVYPLVLFLLKEHKNDRIEENSLKEVLSYLVNFYVRRNIVLKPKSSNIRSRAIQVVRKLQDETSDVNEIALHTTKEIFEDIKPTKEEFKFALSGSVYDTSAKTVRLLLIDIERSYGGFFHKQNPDNLDETNEKGKLIWTLEHILPQNTNISNEWKQMISPNNIDIASSVQMENMHKLGNLTLTSYNPEMSDKSFIDKRDYKPKDRNDFTGLRTGLFINESIAAEEDIKTKENWTIEDIDRRTRELSNLVIKLYPLDD